jgi:hypothetical protein
MAASMLLWAGVFEEILGGGYFVRVPSCGWVIDDAERDRHVKSRSRDLSLCRGAEGVLGVDDEDGGKVNSASIRAI